MRGKKLKSVPAEHTEDAEDGENSARGTRRLRGRRAFSGRQQAVFPPGVLVKDFACCPAAACYHRVVEELLYREETYRIIGSCFEVYNGLFNPEQNSA
jgi:hypothetical protein